MTDVQKMIKEIQEVSARMAKITAQAQAINMEVVQAQTRIEIEKRKAEVEKMFCQGIDFPSGIWYNSNIGGGNMNRFHDLTIDELADMWEVAQSECLTAGLEGNHKSVEFWRKIFNEIIEEIEKRGLTYQPEHDIIKEQRERKFPLLKKSSKKIKKSID